MKRTVFAVVVSVIGLWPAAMRAEETIDGRPLVGFEIGVVEPVGKYEDFVTEGILFSPYAGYMFTDMLGVVGQAHVVANDTIDRKGIVDDDTTWILGASIGPRVELPFEPARIFGTAQVGVFTGPAPNSAVTDTSVGVSTGAGIEYPLSKRLWVGGFGRYNRLYQRVHGEGDVQYVSAGLSFTYDLTPAPPPKVAAAPPPPPAPAPAPAPPVKKKIVLRGVNFDFDKSDLRPDARPVLDEAVATLKQEGAIAVVAEGHTDAVGSDEYNQALSLRRANAVRDYLVAGGIDAARIQVEGYGESRPVASNDTDDGRAQNRRTELRVSGE